MTQIAEHMAKKTPGAGLKGFEHQVDMAAMRQFRLARARAQTERRYLGAFDTDMIGPFGY